MHSIRATEARERLYRLLDDVVASHEPVCILGTRSNAVLVSEDDWRSIQETLHAMSVPGMRKSIVEGLKTPIEECFDEPGW